jgi:hypothetical protein
VEPHTHDHRRGAQDRPRHRGHPARGLEAATVNAARLFGITAVAFEV